MRNLDSHTQTSSNIYGKHEFENFYDRAPLQFFLYWFEEIPFEHQVEIAEFIGQFCFQNLFVSLGDGAQKVFACKEYLRSHEGIIENEEKLVLFVDDIIEFIIEINEMADSNLFACEEVIFELSNIISLYSMINELPQWSKKWLSTYQSWKRFRNRFTIFDNLKTVHQIFDGNGSTVRKNLMRNL